MLRRGFLKRCIGAVAGACALVGGYVPTLRRKQESPSYVWVGRIANPICITGSQSITMFPGDTLDWKERGLHVSCLSLDGAYIKVGCNREPPEEMRTEWPTIQLRRTLFPRMEEVDLRACEESLDNSLTAA